VKNFLKYADDKHYDGTIFHRVISGFMIQGGGFKDYKEQPTREPVRNEAGNNVSNARGTLAMARTGNPDSATAQFFINHRDNKGLDRAQAADRFGYTVFGKVIDGMDVVDKIAGVETGQKEFMAKDRTGGLSKATFPDVPVKDVVIKSIKRVTN
jgi:cyclophilin family peptidyl-prolyl cis-trans isomerase